MLEFDTLDFDLVPNQNVVSNSDMITMLYDEEVFISQIEANSFIFVNPGAIDDGRGRATTSVQNSRRSNTKTLIQLALLARSIYCLYYPFSPFCVGGIVNTVLNFIANITKLTVLVVAAVAAVVYVSKVVVKVAQEAIKVAEKVVDYASDKANEVTDKIADVGGW
jgi:hypothetical protein